MKEFDISVLIQATNDYFEAEQDRKIFLRNWTGGWWEGKTAKECEEYTKHEERSTERWNAVCMMCRLVGVDLDTLVSMVKAINRWESHSGKWDRPYCIHVSWRDERATRQALEKPDPWETQYYHSTGRKICA